MTRYSRVDHGVAVALSVGALLWPNLHSGAYADTVLVDQNQKRSGAYFVLQAEMTDPDTFFQHYAVPAEVSIAANGGRPVVATFDKTVVEGEWTNNWTIVLNFPSPEIALDWYYSEEYQSVLPIRMAATAYSNMAFFPGLPESAIEWRVSDYERVDVRLTHPMTLDPTPEYILTLDAEWESLEDHGVPVRGRYRLEGLFEPIDAAGTRLSMELQASGVNGFGHKDKVRVYLIDTAGKRTLLAKRRTAHMTEHWYTLEVKLDRFTNPSKRYNRVAIEVSGSESPSPSQTLKLRNFKIRK